MTKIIIVWLMLAGCLVAQAQSSLSGTISDNQGKPLVGATIYFPESNRGTITDKNGKYVIHQLPNGKISVQFSYLGYSSWFERLNLRDTILVLNITLQPSVIKSEEIVITGGYNSTQHENAVKIEVFDPGQLENRSSPSFAALLTSIPGVDLISKGSGIGKPVIRGLSMNDILVLYQGVRFENYQYSSHHPLGIDEYGISGVEVIKGPASLLYGSDAIGGVVNFLREKPAPVHQVLSDYSADFFSNSLGYSQQLGVKGASDRFSAGIRVGEKSHADYLQGGGDYVPNTRFRSQSLHASAGYNGKYGGSNFYFDYMTEEPGLVEPEALQLITKRERRLKHFYQKFNTQLFSSQNKLYLGRMKLDLNSSFQQTMLTHFGEDQLNELQMQLGTLSYEAKLHLPSDLQSEYIIGFQGFSQKNKNLEDREILLLPDAQTTNQSVFFLIQRTLFDRFKLQMGGRFDHRKISSESIGEATDSAFFRPALDRDYRSISTSAGGTYYASEGLLLRINLATAYRTPNLAELSSKGQHETRFEVGDRNLLPEQSFEADLSMHYHREFMTLDLAAFQNAIRNYIFISPTSEITSDGIPVYRYLQENAILRGGEAGIHIHPTNQSWLHMMSSLAMVFGSSADGDYLPFIPATRLNFELRLEKENFRNLSKVFAGINATQAFSQKRAALDETRTNAFFLLDLTTGARLKTAKRELEFVVGVNNLLDRKYIDHLSTLKEVGFYNPGRNFTFSIKLPLVAHQQKTTTLTP